jgi:phosphoglycolate phosphatase
VPRTILLDLDGTLIDSRPGIAASCEAALRALGHVPDPSFDVTPLIGPPMPRVIARLLEQYGDDRVEAGIDAYRAHYGEIGLHMAVVYPGIADALRHLSAGARCCVVTSKRSVYAVRIVESFGLAENIRGVYGTIPDGSLDEKSDLIAEVLRTEALDPHETIMIGDRSHDVIGAHANGLRAIGVLWGYGSREELSAVGADALINEPTQLATAVGVRHE